MEMEKKFHSENNSDRISELPESIRVHILSFLETREAVRTSILSSSWRALSTLLPNLDLSSYLLGPYLMNSHLSKYDEGDESIIRMREGFYAFLDQFFASTSKLDKIKLYVPDFGLGLSSRLDHWLDLAVRRGVNELELVIGAGQGPRYGVPKNVLSAKTIMKLKLQKCELKLSSKMDTVLPLLQELCLQDVIMDEMIMGSLLDSCVNLKYFICKNCQGLTKLEIIGLMNLEKVKVEQYDLEAIKIDAPNVLEFSYTCAGYPGGDKCQIELKGCEKMKHLELNCSPLDDTDLDALLENLPFLENLFLENCDSLVYIEIYSHNLVNLAIDNCRELVKIKTATPNLKFFTYYGEDPITLVHKGPALKLTHANISLKPGFKGDQWFRRLIKFLAKLSHSECLSLEVATEKDVIIPESVRTTHRAPLYAVKNLSIEFQLSRLKSPVEVVSSLLWLAPCPESLLIANGGFSNRKLMKFLYEKPSKGKKKCGCWKSLPINCWRHSLKTVLIENQGGVKDDTKLINFFENNRIDGKVECSSEHGKAGSFVDDDDIYDFDYDYDDDDDDDGVDVDLW